MAKTEAQRTKLIQEATDTGLEFPTGTEQILNNQDRLHLLDPLSGVRLWTESLIKKRTRNTLELAWDGIKHWLFD